MNDRTKRILEKAQAKDSIKQEFDATLKQKVERYLEVKPHGIIPNTPFAPASSECSRLFRDGHFYGCISLTQSVTEAIVRFLCERNGWKADKDFETNVKKLRKRGFLDPEQVESLLDIWKRRDDYHHLNPSVEKELRKLEVLAKGKLQLLNKIESEIFAFTTNNGKIVPKHPKYWTQTKSNVFLRLD